jgi:hypothetical protein
MRQNIMVVEVYGKDCSYHSDFRERGGILFKGTSSGIYFLLTRLHFLKFPEPLKIGSGTSHQVGTKSSTHEPLGDISYSNHNTG